MRILTVNLFNHHVHLDALADLLDRLRPEVVAAQELCPHAARVLAARFPHGLLDPRSGSAGMGLVAGRPLAVDRLSLPYRDALVAAGDPSIWSVHLANPAGGPRELLARRRQVRELLAALNERNGHRRVVVGDMNATPAWPAYKRITESLDDGVVAWHRSRGDKPAATWAIRPGTRPWLRIDHVFVSGVEVKSLQTVPVRGSDHHGLLVEVD